MPDRSALPRQLLHVPSRITRLDEQGVTAVWLDRRCVDQQVAPGLGTGGVVREVARLVVGSEFLPAPRYGDTRDSAVVARSEAHSPLAADPTPAEQRSAEPIDRGLRVVLDGHDCRVQGRQRLERTAGTIARPGSRAPGRVAVHGEHQHRRRRSRQEAVARDGLARELAAMAALDDLESVSEHRLPRGIGAVEVVAATDADDGRVRGRCECEPGDRSALCVSTPTTLRDHVARAETAATVAVGGTGHRR